MLINSFMRFDEERYSPTLLIKNTLPSKEQIDRFLDKVETDEEEQGLTRIAIPRREWVHYRTIQGLRKKHLKGFRQAWDKAKPGIAAAYAVDKGIDLKKAVPLDLLSQNFQQVFTQLRIEFGEEANSSFNDGINAGNNYFEDMFKVPGLNNEQIELLQKDYIDVFEVKSQDLFEVQALNALDSKSPDTFEDILSVLNGFDRFLLSYAGIALGVAYDIFVNAIDVLNDSIIDKLGTALFGERPFAVQWVLGDVLTGHSLDCILMSRGDFTVNGIGVWDARELADSGMTPQSHLLDCGSSCKCHLRPIAFDSNAPSENNFLQSFTSPFQLNDVFRIVPNMESSDLKNLFQQKKWIIPESIQESISDNPFLRRREFWENIPERTVRGGVEFKFTKGTTDGWTIKGQTDLVGRGAKTAPGRIDIDIIIPKGLNLVRGDVPLGAFPPEVLDQINKVIGHELGHTFMFSVPEFALGRTNNRALLSTIFNQQALERIKEVAQDEYDFYLSRLNQDIRRNIKLLNKDSLPSDLVNDVRWLEEVLSLDPKMDIGIVLRNLYDRARKGERISLNIDGEVLLVDPSQVLNAMTMVLRKMGIGDDLISFYQLYSVDEYFAEYIGLFLSNPQQARLANERLARALRKEFDEFGESLFDIKDDLRIPDQISINQLQDIPSINPLTIFPPNAEFKDIIGVKQITSITRGIQDQSARRQIREVFNGFPGLLRTEFFDDDLSVTFVSRDQMRKRTGTSRNVASYDSDNSDLIINLDRWKVLSKSQRAEVLAGIASDTLIKKVTDAGKTRMRNSFVSVISDVFSFIEAKAGRQGIDKSTVTNLRNIILGDDGQGILDTSRDLVIWKENFDSSIAPLLKKITDLPIRNVESLRDPESLFRAFLQTYISNPQGISKFEEDLYNILGNSLNI
jgi:hypothetical protein